ncbi:uncharacterized protein LOC127796725 [Diospyros lotus]|uniref:uncharacterized protein LOC127796725 n=1 Tax=Diospyros lotus TaxID=55363 RepID=UPI0022559762|nr:uncharacterized protein LOC127796725 [Diospyros lotus]
METENLREWLTWFIHQQEENYGTITQQASTKGYKPQLIDSHNQHQPAAMAKLPVVSSALMMMKMKWVLVLFVLWFSSASALPPKVLPRRVRCREVGFPKCFKMWYFCPSACRSTCLMDCVSCKPVCSCDYPGAVCQDPRFVGGDGITFYFHGRKDQDFCLLSDADLHINAHFIGKRNPNLKRDFTWVQSIGVLFGIHNLLVAAKPTSTWDDAVDRLDISFDGAPIPLPAVDGAKWMTSPTAPIVSVTRTSDANRVTVEVAEVFRVNAQVVPITAEESRIHGYNITDEDCFAHLELAFKFYNLTDMVDGVMGQTYRRDYVSKVKVNSVMPVMGGAGKFSTSGIFAADCKAARFGQRVGGDLGSGRSASAYSTVVCKSGGEGNGVVCKR